MQRCPICGNNEMQGLLCGRCGYDRSSDYEQFMTLCAVPLFAKTSAAQKKEWEEKQSGALFSSVLGALACPKCGGISFSYLIDDRELFCLGCGEKIPVDSVAQREFHASEAAVTAVENPGVLVRHNSRDRIAAGMRHTLGLRADGTVVAAGDNEGGQCDVEMWKDIVAVVAGALHTVGLKADGTVVAAGGNSFGECDVEGWEDIVAVAAGDFHTFGLKADGTVVVAGGYGSVERDVKGWEDIVSVAAGRRHTVGLKADGTVLAVGYNGCGQCNVEEWEDIVSIAVGTNHTVGLKANGTAIAVGDNGFGQCDVGKWRILPLDTLE